MVRRSGIEGAEHQIPKMERRCGVRNSPPDGAEVRCAEHQIRVRCPALQVENIKKIGLRVEEATDRARWREGVGAIAEGMKCIRPPSDTRKNRIKAGQ